MCESSKYWSCSVSDIRIDPSKVWPASMWIRKVFRPKSVPGATYQDLDEILTLPWVKRIWTYQEIILALRPVIVCGDHHIQWSQFSDSLTFLHHISQRDVLGMQILLTTTTWMDILVTKENVGSHSGALDRNRRERYEFFLNRVSRAFHNVLIVMALVVFCATLMITIGLCSILNSELREYMEGKKAGNRVTNSTTSMVNSTTTTNYKSTKAPVQLSASYVFFMVSFVLSLPIIIYVGTILRSMLSRFRKKPQSTIDLNENLIDTIYSRRATNPKDVAFGVRAVLELLLNRSLPPPDYSMSLNDIYKELTIHILQQSSTLEVLIPAALTHQPFQPSWVPDWQAGLKSHKYWMKLERSYFFSQTLKPQWRLNPEKRTITVWGKKLCTVDSLFRFQPTSGAYRESEEKLHIQNLQTMLDLFKSESGIRLFMHLKTRYYHSSVDGIPEADAASYKAWLLSHKDSQTPVEQLFKSLKFWNRVGDWTLRLTRGFRMYRSYGGALRAHVQICDSLALSHRRIFQATALSIPEAQQERSKATHLRDIWRDQVGLGELGRKNYDAPSEVWKPKTMGICTGEAAVGDHILVLSGLATPMVIRPDGTSGSFQLVSPAIVESAVFRQIHNPIYLEGDREEFTLS